MGELIRITKDNPNRDRGLIAVDAICSVVENQEAKNVSIMTMDGFWYDVVDPIEKFEEILVDTGKDKFESQDKKKKDYFRQKRMMTPATANERAPQNHEEFVTTIKGERDSNLPEQRDRFSSPSKRQKYGKRTSQRNDDVAKNLPSSEGKGHYDIPPKPSSRDASTDMKGL